MLSFKHANGLGTGSELIVEMCNPEAGAGGGFVFRIANQSSVETVDGNGRKMRNRFDGECAQAYLTANQTTHLIRVLEGHAKRINGGKGVFDNESEYVSILHCDYDNEHVAYAIHIIMRSKTKKTEGRILLNPTEAATICKAVNSAMGWVAFGREEALANLIYGMIMDAPGDRNYRRPEGCGQ